MGCSNYLVGIRDFFNKKKLYNYFRYWGVWSKEFSLDLVIFFWSRIIKKKSTNIAPSWGEQTKGEEDSSMCMDMDIVKYVCSIYKYVYGYS